MIVYEILENILGIEFLGIVLRQKFSSRSGGLSSVGDNSRGAGQEVGTRYTLHND